VAETSLRRAASSKEIDMYLLNFNVNIAHGIQEGVAIGGGHFALLGGWDADGHLVVADVNPKKYLRYWRCTPARMFKAMQVWGFCSGGRMAVCYAVTALSSRLQNYSNNLDRFEGHPERLGSPCGHP
jgi:hypothetical protein